MKFIYGGDNVKVVPFARKNGEFNVNLKKILIIFFKKRANQTLSLSLSHWSSLSLSLPLSLSLSLYPLFFHSLSSTTPSRSMALHPSSPNTCWTRSTGRHRRRDAGNPEPWRRNRCPDDSTWTRVPMSFLPTFRPTPIVFPVDLNSFKLLVRRAWRPYPSCSGNHNFSGDP